MIIQYKNNWMDALPLEEFVTLTGNNERVFNNLYGSGIFCEDDNSFRWSIYSKELGTDVLLITTAGGRTKYAVEWDIHKSDFTKFFAKKSWFYFLKNLHDTIKNEAKR